MIDLSFSGYRPIPAGADDPLRVKWNEMRADLGISRPVFVEPDLSSVSAFNARINRLIAFDQTEAESLDAWLSPDSTIVRGRGDCKDFALLKYAVMSGIGLPVAIVLGEIKSTLINNPQHAWCAVFIDGAWHAIDNLFDQPVRVEDYLNWIPHAAMHDASVVRFGREFTMADMMK